MPTVLDWNPAVDPSELVRPVGEALAAGSLVVLPGDVGYVALVNPAAPRADDQLQALAGIAGAPPAVLAYGPDDAAAFGLSVPVAARRLMLRAWPAPLTIAFPAAGAALAADWPEPVRDRLRADGLVRFRCPDHPVFDAVTAELAGRFVAVETLLPTAAAVTERLGDAVDLLVAGGECKTGERPTVVSADDAGWRVVEPGAFTADDLHKLAARIVLFVCTGNTCRSPLAEGLAKRLLAERLGCAVEELPARGFWLLSAGVATYGGMPATPESIDAAAELGADLGPHRSRPVNPQLLAATDEVVAMTRGHAEALATRFPGTGPGIKLLCGEDADLDDPIGSGLDVYRECARTILRHLERLIPQWVGP
jgi:protein-tyrosine phosphatase